MTAVLPVADLYAQYRRPAVSLARRLTGDQDVAEEIVQDVFAALVERPAAYDPARGPVGTWVLSAVHHRAVDAVRRAEAGRRARRRVVTEKWAQRPAPMEETAIRSAMVWPALAGLPAREREVLALAYWAGYSQPEIAVLTGTPLGTVKSRTFHGLRRLRAVLGGVR